jgi:hypothetical protein
MKNKFNGSFVPIVTLLFALFIFTTVVEAQEKSKKQLKEEKQLEKRKQIGILVESKEFVFVTYRAMPQSGSVINLTTEYNVDFHPEWIKSDLPFFGRGFSGIGYGGTDAGIKFEAKPTVYTVKKKKKNYVMKFANILNQQDVVRLVRQFVLFVLSRKIAKLNFLHILMV